MIREIRIDQQGLRDAVSFGPGPLCVRRFVQRIGRPRDAMAGMDWMKGWPRPRGESAGAESARCDP